MANTQISWLCLVIILFSAPRPHYLNPTKISGLLKACSSSHGVVSTPFHADSVPKDRGYLPSVVQLKAGSRIPLEVVSEKITQLDARYQRILRIRRR